ncbi:MAG TPA: YjbQ family protein [Firmicutes bacterium]|nr:YjbQ family protein [Bacillota bacterium]
MWRELAFNTRAATEFLEITRDLAVDLQKAGVRQGVGTIFIPHTTAGLMLNENADPDVLYDLKLAFDQIFPHSLNRAHQEGNSAAHLRAALVGSSLHLPVEDGRLRLGTWQGVYLCEFDGPRRRRILVRWDGN